MPRRAWAGTSKVSPHFPEPQTDLRAKGCVRLPKKILSRGLSKMTDRNRARLSKLSLALFAVLATSSAFAQSTSAGLGGRVVGANGQPVAGAEVTIVHTESGTVSKAVTDANGRYSARGLRVGGPYTVTVNQANAGTKSQNNVYLGLDKVSQVDLSLAPQELETIS